MTDRTEAARAGGGLERLLFPAVVLLVLLAFLPQVGLRPVSETVESRVALTTREMLRSGDWILPRLLERRRLEKPPLAYWLPAAAATLAGGLNDYTLRLPFAGVALATILCACAISRARDGPRAALLAALALLGSPLFMHDCLAASADVALLGAVAGAWFFLWRARGPGGGRGDRFGLWFCLGLGLLAKGPVVLVPVLGPALLEALLARSLLPLKPFGSLAGAGVFLILGLAWPALVLWRPADLGLDTPNAVETWLGESMGKMGLPGVRDSVRHSGDWFFYLPRLLRAFGLWALLLPLACWGPLCTLARAARAGWGRAGRPAPPAAELAAAAPFLWLAATLLFFSLVPEKKQSYILPLLPAGAILVGAAALEWAAAARFFAGLSRAAGAALLVALPAALPFALRPADLALLHPAAAALDAGMVRLAFLLLPAALLTAWLVARLFARGAVWRAWTALGAAVALLLAAGRLLQPATPDELLSRQARLLPSRPGVRLVAFGNVSLGFLYYLERDCGWIRGDRPQRLQQAVRPGTQVLVSAADAAAAELDPDSAAAAPGAVLKGGLAGYRLLSRTGPQERGDPLAVVLLLERL